MRKSFGYPNTEEAKQPKLSYENNTIKIGTYILKLS